MTETNTDALMEILPDLLAPLLMAGTVGDPARARRAAQQAIEQYQAGTQCELVTIGQIVAFALTAIDNLRLSMPDTVSMSMKLKLRGNANALNRASLHAVAALDKSRSDAEPLWATAADEPEPIATPAPEPPPATPPVKTQNSGQWATAMATVATELRARSTLVPPTQRNTDQLWVEVLANLAGDLRQPDAAANHARLSKTELFRTTVMAGSGSPSQLTRK